MTDAGFTRGQASIGLALTGAANLCSKFVWGWTLQRFPVRRLSGSAFASSAIGVAVIVTGARADTLWLIWLGFFIWGFGFGGTIPIGEFIWARYFGRRYLGSVRGLAVPFTILFGSLGPISIALYFDATSRYGVAFGALTLVYIIGGLLILSSREPPPKVQPATV